jgi:metal-responsive CopG/Arc/MetJ family transcriptional regulator
MKLSVSIPDDLYHRVSSIATPQKYQRGTSISGIVTEALREWVRARYVGIDYSHHSNRWAAL